MTGYAFSHAEGYTAEAASDATLRDDDAPEDTLAPVSARHTPGDIPMKTTAITSRIATQHAEMLHRLADRADRAGVRILVEPARGEHFATDPAAPARLYRVDADACSCRRFRVWGRCPHHALLLAELGRIPDPVSVVASPAPRPLERQYLRPRVPHPRLPGGALVPAA